MGGMPLKSVFVNLECRDAGPMAAFHAGLLDAEVSWFAGMPEIKSDHVKLNFETSEGYRPPTWPTQARGAQAHLDFYYETEAEYREAIDRAIALGGRRHETQTNQTWWTVITDPAGHPVCLCRAE